MNGPIREDRSTSLDDQRAPKRPKIYQACNFCQRRKTRCEGITANGCARCNTLAKKCSLAVTPPSGKRNGATQDSPAARDITSSDNTALVSSMLSESQRKTEELQRKTELMEERLRILEQAFRSKEATSGSQTNEGAEYLPTGDKEGQSRMPGLPISIENPLLSHEDDQSRMQIIDFSELFFSISTDNACRHPVKQGILTQPQADAAFQVFKHIFARVLPLDCFFTSSTPTPTHGFLLTSILVYVSRAAPSICNFSPLSIARLNRLLEDSLLYILSGSTSDDVLLGLLVLSLKPSKTKGQTRDEKPNAEASAFRLISLAFQIGGASGLAAACRSAAALTLDMQPRWMAKVMHRFQLWMAIVNRHFLLSAMHSRASGYDWDTYNRAAHGFEGVLEINSEHESFRHLRQEQILACYIGPLLSKLSDLEGKMTIEADDLSFLSEEWQLAREQVDSWRRSLAVDLPTRLGLSADSRCIEFAIGLRLSCFIQRLPSPVSADVRSLGLSKFGPSCVHTANDTNRIILEEAAPGPHPLPEYVLILLAVAIVVQYRSAMFVLQTYAKVADFVHLERMEATAKALQEEDGVAALLCRQAIKMWKFTMEQHEHSQQQQHHHEALAAPCPADDFFNSDFFNFNLNWDPSLVLFQDMLGTL